MEPRLLHRFADVLPEFAVPWQAQPAPEPQLMVLQEDLAEELGLDVAWLRTEQGLRFLTGEYLPEGTRPVAQVYAGHQFGGYSPRLGDGRALLLGEIAGDASGAASEATDADPAPAASSQEADRDGALVDLHLKGSGRTPLARGGADGNAALGPMLREHLVGEALHALGVPTSRALAVVATGTTVHRPGTPSHPEAAGTWAALPDSVPADPRVLAPVPGAVLARTAASHLRVGTVQYARAMGEEDLLHRVVRTALERHHPEGLAEPVPALALYRHVVRAQAQLVARWMEVGFVHGVMNTDNMTLSGQSLDFGPCAFLDAHQPDAVFSSIDRGGRYRYRNQPGIAQWNLARLGEALLPLLDPHPDRGVELVQEELERFRHHYDDARVRGWRTRLGLGTVVGSGSASAAGPGADSSERASASLEEIRELGEGLEALLARYGLDHTLAHRALAEWAEVGATGTATEAAEDAAVPAALAPAAADPEFMAWTARWRALRPDPAVLVRANPAIVPRNHHVARALAAAEAGDLTPYRELLDAVTHPFDPTPQRWRWAEPPAEDLGRFVSYCGT